MAGNEKHEPSPQATPVPSGGRKTTSASPGEIPVSPARTASGASQHRAAQPGPKPGGHHQKVMRHSAVASDLHRVDDKDMPMRIMVELNLRYHTSLTGAEKRFRDLYAEVVGSQNTRLALEIISNNYVLCALSPREWSQLLWRDTRNADDSLKPANERCVYRIWKDYDVHPLMDRAAMTVKGDAARRTFGADGRDIVWAVVDSGVDAGHAHFRRYDTLAGPVQGLHRDFTVQCAIDESEEQRIVASIASALADASGHGTHVAGIIAGGLDANLPREKLRVVQEAVLTHDSGDGDIPPPQLEDLPIEDSERMAGVAPRCKLVSIKVLPDEGTGSASTVMKALQYIREKVNGNSKELVIHGVNLSLGYEFDAELYACGQSPLCVEVDKLVRSGVVVVAAAGNTGYGRLTTNEGQTHTGMSLTINDPGNAAMAITVGATHAYNPHTYGVSFFSSKGPTGDGRLKPELVAPGERIISCATGSFLADICQPEQPVAGVAYYLDRSGTSMAAPHVAGVIAAFLSIRREYIGRPEEVKRIFLENALSLGRERYFEGYGLVDLMRAIQAV